LDSQRVQRWTVVSEIMVGEVEQGW